MNVAVKKKEITHSTKEIVAIPYKVLQDVLKKAVTGTLTIQDPNDQSVQWRLYLGKGKIYFASSLKGKRERLSYILSHYFPKNNNFYIPKDLECDYKFITQQWQNGYIDLATAKQILEKITQEALLLCLALPRAALQFTKTLELNPLLVSLNLKSLVLPIKSEVRDWLQLRSNVNSPFVRPILKDQSKINSSSQLNSHWKKELENLTTYFEDHCTVYTISTLTNKSTLELAKVFDLGVLSGGMKMLPYEQLDKQNLPLIACIDDSQAIQRIIKMTLQAGGFEVMSITEPAKAMTTFVRQKPDLILMDINMPEIDGYKLAYMMRQSALLKDIPIIMLTGRDGGLDRVKAKMVGAVGYICKPFNPQELVQSIHNNISVRD